MQIAEKLLFILNTPGLAVAEEGAFATAVELYAQHGLDLADCFAAAPVQQCGSHLASYDRGLDLGPDP